MAQYTGITLVGGHQCDRGSEIRERRNRSVDRGDPLDGSPEFRSQSAK